MIIIPVIIIIKKKQKPEQKPFLHFRVAEGHFVFCANISGRQNEHPSVLRKGIFGVCFCFSPPGVRERKREGEESEENPKQNFGVFSPFCLFSFFFYSLPMVWVSFFFFFKFVLFPLYLFIFF